jgi:hypothetical protein
VLYEAVLAGNWDGRFGQALQVVAREEYAYGHSALAVLEVLCAAQRSLTTQGQPVQLPIRAGREPGNRAQREVRHAGV